MIEPYGLAACAFLFAIVFLETGAHGAAPPRRYGQPLGLRVFSAPIPRTRLAGVDRPNPRLLRALGVSRDLHRPLPPLVLTFAPFLPGAGTMCYHWFPLDNILGAAARWSSCSSPGLLPRHTARCRNQHPNPPFYGMMALTAGSVPFISFRIAHGNVRRRAA